MNKMWKVAFSTGIMLISVETFATNGMLLTSYGARYAGMGGASLALHGSAMDIATNPANMARNEEKAIIEGGVYYMMPKLTYEDMYIVPDAPQPSAYTNSLNSKDNKTKGFIMPHIAYTRKVSDRMAVGLGFYAYAGAGAQFNGITRNVPGFSGGNLFGGAGQNPNPTIDQLMAKKGLGAFPLIGGARYMKENTFSQLQIAKLTPGVAYKVTDKLSVGLGVDVGIGTLEWRWTFSDPMGAMELPGAGYRYKGNTAYALSGHVGATYQLTDSFAVAYSYQAISKYHFNGKTSIDAGDPMKFRALDTSMFLQLPESHRGGVAYHKGAVTLSFDLGYVKWSNAVNVVKFSTSQTWANLPPVDASVANDPKGNDLNSLNFNMKWVDQRIYAVGFEYKPNTTAFRLGYNYGNSPIKSYGVNPLFPAITEHHASLGLGKTLGNLDFDFAIEKAFYNQVSTSDTSDWEMFHAFSAMNQAGIQMPWYKASVGMSILTPMFAIKYRFN